MACPVNPLTFCCEVNAKTNNYPTQGTNGTASAGEFRELAMLQFSTPQPHFNPGYTGYTPGSTDNMLGLTYGHYTNRLLTEHPVGGGRLRKLPRDCTIHIVQNPPERLKDNPHETFQPHFVPGYTGFTPSSGIRRSEGIGQTYGRMTHIMLARHEMEGGRLRPIDEYPKECVSAEEDMKFYCYQHELTRDDVRRWKDQVPGYAGHVPRALFRHGKNKTKIAEESIAEFQRILNK